MEGNNFQNIFDNNTIAGIIYKYAKRPAMRQMP